jgi:chemotaxis protein methyltransferase CheR
MTAPLSLEPVGIPGLTAAEFSDFRGLVAARLGIALGPHKADLVRARLIKRLRALRLASFRAYHDYLCDAVTGGAEWPHFVHAITTKKTEFFREAHHFAHLAGPWAEERRRAAAAGAPRRRRRAAAACATGEEAST